MSQEIRNDIVSIIVPVYQVENYIDQCLKSISKQTYTELEIILVYDTSEDNTLQKCKKWAEKDSRIKLLINSKRGGLGAARNQGLRIATGQYIMYVDSDDWIDVEFVAKLHQAIRKSNANFVAGGGYYSIKRSGKKTYHGLPTGMYSSKLEREIFLLKDVQAVWMRIYNRQWLLDNQLFQPEQFRLEDWAYNPRLVLTADRIEVISEIGNYYREGREGSLSENINEFLCNDYEKSMIFILHELTQYGMLNEHSEVIYRYIMRVLYQKRNIFRKKGDNALLEELNQIKINIIDKNLRIQEENINQLIVFGSFSMRWIAQRAALGIESIEYFGFSSMISAMNQSASRKIVHDNVFRQQQVDQDITGEFYNRISQIHEKTYLFLDFLEERNSLLELDSGEYVTYSEAFQEADIEGEIEHHEVIQSGSEKFMRLWKESCEKLCNILREKEEYVTVILVRNRMSLLKGDLNHTTRFENENELLEINKMISNMEEFFLNHMPGVMVMDLPEKYCFTDELFNYGCDPQYMNEALYTYVGFELFRKLICDKD